jgi:hypothetical protein
MFDRMTTRGWPTVRLRSIAGLLSAPVLILTACSSSSSGGSHTTPTAIATTAFATQSATAILAASKADAEAKGSVHDEGRGQVGGGLSLVGHIDVNATEGTQSSQFGPHPVNEIFAGGVAYVRADAFALEQVVGLTHAQASQYAGKWLAFHAGDAGYADAIDGMTLASGLHTTLDLVSAKTVGTSTVNGVQVVGVAGRDPDGDTETVYISVASPHLPVSSHSTGNGADVQETFSRWGETVHASAPPGAVRAPH